MRIREYRPTEGTAIQRMYQAAFAGFPWYEDLSDLEVRHRWERDKNRIGFRCIVAEELSKSVLPIGALWWDTPTLTELRAERGEELQRFVSFAAEHVMGGTCLTWERDIIVSPGAQGQGIGTELRREFLYRASWLKNALIFTRMRDDNLPIIRIAEKLGFSRTGITVPSSQAPGVCHEYWYRFEGPKGDSR